MNLADEDQDYPYEYAPYLVDLQGTHYGIGFDYAALLHNETSFELTTFEGSLGLDDAGAALVNKFIDWLWFQFLLEHVPPQFLDELQGMHDYHVKHGSTDLVDTDVVARRFYTVSNLPADPANLLAMLEHDLEEGLPEWLAKDINWIIEQVIKLLMKCDAYGVWGSRTEGGLLFSSRNLDYSSDTGINKYKLVSVLSITDPKYYNTADNRPIGGKQVTLGFALGIGALAGMNANGVTVSEMNLDNSVVTFQGVPFPLRLRYILLQATNLDEALKTWDATNNTNSFNFLIGSATDALNGNNGAKALETIRDFTAKFGANSDVEKNATYDCSDGCSWTNQTGMVHIGTPLPHAVWRTNHGFNPKVMKTQDPLFKNTIVRYNLMHDLFKGLQQDGTLIGNTEAVGIVATLGTKGGDDWTVCDESQFGSGDNVMSISYAPGKRSANCTGEGYFTMAWESGSGDNWRPAACSTFLEFRLADWGYGPSSSSFKN